VSDLTGHNEIVGSAAYMAPETWVGRGIGPPSDIYSLGILAYELLTHRLPFDAETTPELMWKHLEEAPVPPSRYVAGIPSWLEQLVLAMMEKGADRRPCAAGEISEYLIQCMEGASPSVTNMRRDSDSPSQIDRLELAR